VRQLKLTDFIEPDEDPIEALKKHGLPGTIDANVQPPVTLEDRIATLEYAISLQAKYIEYIRGFLEAIVSPHVGGAAPHDMEIWVAMKSAPSKEEAEKAIESIMTLRRARASRIIKLVQ
jgi:hypothetical protein